MLQYVKWRRRFINHYGKLAGKTDFSLLLSRGKLLAFSKSRSKSRYLELHEIILPGNKELFMNDGFHTHWQMPYYQRLRGGGGAWGDCDITHT